MICKKLEREKVSVYDRDKTLIYNVNMKIWSKLTLKGSDSNLVSEWFKSREKKNWNLLGDLNHTQSWFE